LEFSVVPVPANQAALKKMLASAGGEIEDKAFKIIKDFFTDDNFDHTPEGWIDKLNKTAERKIQLKHIDITVGHTAQIKDIVRAIVKEELFIADKEPVIAYEKFDLAAEETNWNETDVIENINQYAGDDLQKYQKAFGYVFNREDKFTYKFCHHDVIEGKMVTVWRGVAKAAIDLFENESIPKDIREKVYEHLKQHYAEFNKTAPEFGKKEEEPKEEQPVIDDNVINEIARAIVAMMKKENK
jgi:hypothetical protein